MTSQSTDRVVRPDNGQRDEMANALRAGVYEHFGLTGANLADRVQAEADDNRRPVRPNN